MGDHLGCGSSVSYRFVYPISADICGETDEGGLARQQQEFKTYRKSTALAIMDLPTVFLLRLQSAGSVLNFPSPL